MLVEPPSLYPPHLHSHHFAHPHSLGPIQHLSSGMAPKKQQYQGQGELDFTKEEASDMTELLGFPLPSGEERALSTDSATSNVEVYSQSPTERRRTQLREAQRKHRQRRQDQMEDLQTQVQRLSDQIRQAERDKAMLYNILQRVLAQLESQRQAFTSDLPQLVERSVAAHFGTTPSPTMSGVTAATGTSGLSAEIWAQAAPTTPQYAYSHHGHSPVMGYEMPQPAMQQQQQQRFAVPTCHSPIIPSHPSSVSPYERPSPSFSWSNAPQERDPSLWLNEDEARLLNSFSGVTRA